ncbi:MAG: Amino-acid acetyltransferase [Verrucomicrobia bacterium ADurb.Bin345]|nr:MAG: Amino-acid acetyltransferase [Verrucomicrobia bacterium ADurb.Bin345]
MSDKSWKVRNAGFEDASAIFNLIRAHPQELVPRSMSDIIQNVDRFLVAEAGGRVIGTVSWGILPEIGNAAHPTVEIKSLAVDATARGVGAGRGLVEAAIERVKVLHPEQIIVLTFAPEFFRKFGFAEISKEKIMHKLYTGCLNCSKYDNPLTCPEIAMSLLLR